MTTACREEYGKLSEKESGIQNGVHPTGKEPRDTIRITGGSSDRNLSFAGKLQADHRIGPFTTNLPADSVFWENIWSSPGLTMAPHSGNGGSTAMVISRRDIQTTGELVIRAVPYRSGYISRPVAFAIMVQGDGTPAAGMPVYAAGAFAASHKAGKACPGDTGSVNRERRKTINEFRDLLYMHGRTVTPKEKEFFRSGAEKKLNEFPGCLLDLPSGTTISDLLEGNLSAVTQVAPVYDQRRCYITGISFRHP